MLKIDTYYDITCTCCGRSRSTDFDKGMWMFEKPILRKAAEKEGWKFKNGLNLCPICARQK